MQDMQIRDDCIYQNFSGKFHFTTTYSKRNRPEKCTFISTNNTPVTMSVSILILDGFFHKTKKFRVNQHKQK